VHADKLLVAAVSLMPVFLTLAASQPSAKASPLPILRAEACHVPLTERGMRSTFSGSALYSVDVGRGRVHSTHAPSGW
jgi:hypothetical protein